MFIVIPHIANMLKLLNEQDVISLLAVEFSTTENQNTALLGDILYCTDITVQKQNQMHINRLYKKG